MSSPLALAAVTAVLRDLLNNGLIDHGLTDALGGSFSVSALPPDRVFANPQDETNQLNLFLHRVTPNQGWRNVDLPSRDSRGDRLSNPPLALDLHYLLTAYGADDLHAEILLGYAMQLLHCNPVLTRAAIRESLAPPDAPVNGSILPPALAALSAEDLADQVEQIKITPKVVDCEEMGRMWMALQAHYRPTSAYLVSVVLIESAEPARSPLPVLTRGPVDLSTGTERGVVVQPHLVPPFPTIEEVIPPDRQVAACSGETVAVRGHHLDADQIVARLTHLRSASSHDLAATNLTPTSFQVTMPPDPHACRVGLYSLAAVIQKAGEDPRLSNELPLTLAPTITAYQAQTLAGVTTFEVGCTPAVWQGQRATLVVGDRELSAEPFVGDTTQNLVFSTERSKLPAGSDAWVRLQVDGISSILIDRNTDPPTFHASEWRPL